jgi:hypothetical protein
VGCASLSPRYESEKREAERRQTRIQPSAPYGRGSVLFGARSPVGVPPRLFLEMSEHLRPASGQASWDAAATITLLDGRYPPLPVPVQWHPRPAIDYRRHDAQSRPGEVCETARGHRTRSVIRIASGIRPALSEIRRNVTEIVTNVNGPATRSLGSGPVSTARFAAFRVCGSATFRRNGDQYR